MVAWLCLWLLVCWCYGAMGLVVVVGWLVIVVV